MKKILSFGMALVIMLMSGCFEELPTKESVSSNPAEISSNSNAPSKQTFGLNEAAVFKNLKFAATELTESTGKDYYEPADGNVFVGIKFTIENISSEEQTVSTILLFDAYCDDVKLSYSIMASLAFDEGGTLDGTIAAGKKLVGYYAVEVPENWNTIELEVQQDWLSNTSATFVFNK